MKIPVTMIRQRWEKCNAQSSRQLSQNAESRPAIQAKCELPVAIALRAVQFHLNCGKATSTEAGEGRPLLRPLCLQLTMKTSYLANRTTIAPMRSPFLKSFLGLIGWALWQDTHESAMAKSAAMR